MELHLHHLKFAMIRLIQRCSEETTKMTWIWCIAALGAASIAAAQDESISYNERATLGQIFNDLSVFAKWKSLWC